MSRSKKSNRLDPRVVASQPLPAWVTSMSRKEYDLLDLDHMDLPPLPQRTSRRNNNITPDPTTSRDPPSNTNDTSGSHSNPATAQPSEVSNTITNLNPNTDTSSGMDTTASAVGTITTSTNTMATTASTILEVTTAPVTTFTNVISNMTNYKENLIHQLLGTQGRAATTIQDKNSIFTVEIYVLETALFCAELTQNQP